MRPGWQPLQHGRDTLVQPFQTTALFQSLTIGWIANHAAVFDLGPQLIKILFLKMDIVRDPCPSGMVTRHTQHIRVSIGSDDFQFYIVVNLLMGIFSGLDPKVVADFRPMRAGEGPRQPRRNVTTDQRSFDRNRSATAKRIDQHTARIPDTQLNHGCRQSLLDRCVGHQFSIPAAV